MSVWNHGSNGGGKKEILSKEMINLELFCKLALQEFEKGGGRS